MFATKLPGCVSSGLAALILTGCATQPPQAGVPAGPRPEAGAPVVLRPPTSPSGKSKALRDAVERADRMTVSAALPDGTRGPIREVRGAAPIEDFLDELEIDEDYGEIVSASPVDAVFTFYSGDRQLASLSLRRLGYLRWEDGRWAGDAVLAPATGNWLLEWSRNAGADIRATVLAMSESERARTEDGIRNFLAAFTPEARQIFASSDPVVYHGRRLRQIATPLADLYPDKTEFAVAAFRALSASALPWLDDDWANGAVQTSLMEIDPAVIVAAMRRLEGEPASLLGAARFFFRCGFDTRLDAVEAGNWATKLADIALRNGRHSDRHTVLECVARIPGDATAAFLRGIAQGNTPYTYASPANELVNNIEEPALPHTAAMLLARRGDTQAAALVSALAGRRPSGPDLAAIEVARALLDTRVPLKPSQFKYRSHSIGMSAVGALEWRPANEIAIDVLSAAVHHSEPDVAQEAAKIGIGHRLQAASVSVDSAQAPEFDPMLPSTDPIGAIREYTALIPTAPPAVRARLLALRAQAHAALRNYAAAERDYAEAAASPLAVETDLLTRMAWMQWYQGKFGPAEETIAVAIESNPSSDLALLRGILRYSRNEFSLATDADLLASAVMDPAEGYAPLFQHLSAHLGQRPDHSHLPTYVLTADAMPAWTKQIAAFLLGRLNVTRLLEFARAGNNPEETGWHLCEAYFYASQVARIAGRTEEERGYLLQCLATDQPNVAEFWIAKYRLDSLGVNPGPASPSLPGLPPPSGRGSI